MQGDVQDPRMKMMLARFDKDQDGKVSQEEWITAHQELFGQMDKNGDGTLSTDELAAAPMMRGQGGGEGPAMSGELLKGIMTRFDKDGDGALSKEEAPERMAALFDRLDTNGDGKLTAEELTAAGGRPGLQRKLPGGDAPQGAPGEGGLEGFKRLRQMDKNGDGEFTADEIPAELMQRLDKNGDGKVTKDELQGLRR
jgi:Ca2+-binding EF-hand superfamily protein